MSAHDGGNRPSPVGRRYAPIDFGAINDALLRDAEGWVSRWLPGGTARNGRYYIGDFDGGKGESANVSLKTGTWVDNANFQTDKGGDLISLYARVHQCSNHEAALQLMQQLGWRREPEPPPQAQPQHGPARASQRSPDPAAARAPQGSKPFDADTAALEDDDTPAGDEGQETGTLHQDGQQPPPQAERTSRWVPVVPAPSYAPKPGFKWAYRDKKADRWTELTAVRHWAYRRDDQLLGYVARFERVNSDGEIVKDTLPLTWCRDTTDERGGHRWHWKQWDAPRPLYLPAGTLRPALPVVVVEGEKCAQAGHELLGDEFEFIAWPGGAKTWKLAEWAWIAGRQVTLWPDADCQRERLSREEKAQGIDPLTKPVRPLQHQPGWQAMAGIGAELLAEHGCTVRMCALPDPRKQEEPEGWDIADAIAAGWGAERVRQYIQTAHPYQHPDDAMRTQLAALSSLGSAERKAGEPKPEPLTWRNLLICNSTGRIIEVRDNVVIAMDGQEHKSEWIPGAPECVGIIAFNAFTNDVVKLRATPWGTPAGKWDEVDELEMGAYLSRKHGLPSMPLGTLEEAVKMVAHRRAFHPVRAEFEALRGQWDGLPRLATWIRRTCLEEDEWDDQDPLQRYLARVGTWTMVGMVARVMRPGTKFDYMPILEGGQGMGKSTLARTLGGDYFADTGLVLGDKDSYQNLQGVLVYEWGELDSLSKAEVTKVKGFISSAVDRFRASFDRRPKDYPRQCIFIGTTNEDHYLVDQTGNRRFWPIRVTRQIDIEWLRENRRQLFAEAVHRFEAGERFYPTPTEQRELFDEQQQQRQIESAVQAACMRYLYDENAKFAGAIDNGTLVNDITASELLGRIGISVDKQTHINLRQCTAALRQAGWERYRSSRGDRPWMFRRPAGERGRKALPEPQGKTPKTAAAPQPMEERAVDDCPF